MSKSVKKLLMGLSLAGLTTLFVAFLLVRETAPADTLPLESSRLIGARPSAEGLARAFLIALEAEDRKAIAEMTLTESEFREIVWPEIPASQPSTNLTADFVWRQHHLRSRSSQSEVFFNNLGSSYEFIGLQYTGKTSRYRSFSVHNDPKLTVRNKEGSKRELGLFGAIIEMDGTYKIYSFSM